MINDCHLFVVLTKPLASLYVLSRLNILVRPAISTRRSDKILPRLLLPRDLYQGRRGGPSVLIPISPLTHFSPDLTLTSLYHIPASTSGRPPSDHQSDLLAGPKLSSGYCQPKLSRSSILDLHIPSGHRHHVLSSVSEVNLTFSRDH